MRPVNGLLHKQTRSLYNREVTQLHCAYGCGARYDAFVPRFQCDACGGLLDVDHGDVWSSRSAEAWRTLFAERAASPDRLDRSGVWRFREWVMPGLRPDEVITLGEGQTPLVDIPGLAAQWGLGRIELKQCGQSLTGSFKDLGMTVLVSMANAIDKRAAARGERAVRALLCASTGDTSAALAAYGAAAKIPVMVLLPEGKISPAQGVQPQSAGSRVFALDGDFDDCMRVVQELSTTPGYFLANSKNPLRLEGQKTVALEIAAQRAYKLPDFVLIPSGNLGNVSALAAGFRLLLNAGLTDKMPRLVACQVDAADPLHRAYERRTSDGIGDLEPVTAAATHASAIRIGDPVSFPRAKAALEATDGMVTACSEDELLAAMHDADRRGLFVCPHTATALAGARKLKDAGVFGSDDEVVIVSTAHGLKFSGQKIALHSGTDALTGAPLNAERLAHQNVPQRVAASAAAIVALLENGDAS